MTTLFLIRHGETDWNKAKRWQGLTDIPLNSIGRSQAEALKPIIEPLDYDICLCSPLSRAHETAEIVNNGKAKIITEELLAERSYGDLEGMHPEEDLIRDIWSLNTEYTDNHVENLQVFLDRIADFLDKIKNSNYDKILVVSHGGIMKAIHYNLQGYDKNTDFLDWHVGNCELVTVEI